MRELDFFLGADEAHRVLADDVAASHDGKPYRARDARPRLAVARIDGELPELTTLSGRDAFPQGECRARGRVDLVPMVRFRDLDVVAVAERLGRSSDELH